MEPTPTKPTESPAADEAGSDRGASLVEYALLVALIAIVCFAAMQFLGGEVSDSFSSTAQSVANA